MTKIKMIALDMDGTVFNDDKQITERTRRALAAAISAGVVVLPATGRHFHGLPEAMLTIPGLRYALTCNGAAVYDLFSGEVIYEDPIPWALAAEIVDEQMALGNIPEVYIDGKGYLDAVGFEKIRDLDIPQVLKDYAITSKHPVHHLADTIRTNKRNVHKIHMLFDRRYPEIRRKAFEVMEAHKELTVGYAFDYNMEVNIRTAGKGYALLGLGKRLGIEKEEIMAIGDGDNDIAMLSAVGFPVAMGNAVDELKACAKAITEDNNHDGVACAIEKYVLCAEAGTL